jgi:hypothetical protein
VARDRLRDTKRVTQRHADAGAHAVQTGLFGGARLDRFHFVRYRAEARRVNQQQAPNLGRMM